MMDPKLTGFLNQIRKDGVDFGSLVHLLDTYYQNVIYKVDENAVDDPYDGPFPVELTLPLEKRESGIYDAVSFLLENGCDINGSDGCFNALQRAVGQADAPMAGYLMMHGADATTWLEMDEEPWVDKQNYYLESIDINYMNESFANDTDKRFYKALYQTALVLEKHAHLGPFYGYSLMIDEDGNVTVDGAKVLS